MNILKLNRFQNILIAIIASLASIGFHAYLSYHYYILKLGLNTENALCNISQALNCDTAALSSFATLLGPPLANWGALTHLFLSLLLIISLLGLASNPARITKIAFIFAGAIALVSIVMASISAFVLKSFCLYCAFTYALSFIIFFFLWREIRKDKFSLASEFSSLFGDHKWVVIFALIVPAGSYLSHSMAMDNFGLKELNIMITESVENWKVNPNYEFDRSNALVKGENNNPKMEIVEFADYLCPHCKAAASTLHTFLKKRTDVKFYFKSFPIDGTCNPGIQFKGDGLRCDLAYTVFCAEKDYKKGFQAQEYIFERQSSWNRANWKTDFEKLASSLGLDLENLSKCIQSEEAKNAIAKQAAEGNAAKIQGTPALFVNGKNLEKGVFPPVLEATYQEIKKSL